MTRLSTTTCQHKRCGYDVGTMNLFPAFRGGNVFAARKLAVTYILRERDTCITLNPNLAINSDSNSQEAQFLN